MAFANYKLDNGLQVVVDDNPQCHLTAVGYFVKAGACDETLELSGVSHFLEHMCFKGTPQRSALEINQQLDELGANCNARTGEEHTIYHATVLPEFQSQIVELLSDMMQPSLSDEDFFTEQKVILEEIAMYRDQPPYGGHEQLMRAYFGDHPLGQPVLGTDASVAALTPEAMASYHHQRYSPGNMTLAVAGRVDVPQLLADVERLTKNWPVVVAPSRQFGAGPQIVGREFLQVQQASQQYILQLAPGPSLFDPDRYAARLAAMIFGDDTGSRLFWRLVDSGKTDLAAVGHYEYESTGVLMSMLAMRPEDAAEVWAEFEALEQEFVEQTPTEYELKLAKAKAIASLSSANEISENRMFDIGSQWVTYGSYLTVEQVIELYRQVTLADIIRVTQRFPMHEKQVLAIGPNWEFR
ncbi:MAG: pitrilysin family protein [Pirellulaceae bacterium]|nr:pitrilysin family protein [Pirellulaceae bacterium]